MTAQGRKWGMEARLCLPLWGQPLPFRFSPGPYASVQRSGQKIHSPSLLMRHVRP